VEIDTHICSRAFQPQSKKKSLNSQNENITCARVEETEQDGRLSCNMKQNELEEGPKIKSVLKDKAGTARSKG